MSRNELMAIFLLVGSAWLIGHGIWAGFVKRRISGIGGEYTGGDAIARGVAAVVVGLGTGAFVLAKLLQGRW